MDFGLSERRALIMGGGRGIGFGIAHALAKEGADVVLAGRDVKTLDNAVGVLKKIGPSVRSISCDLASRTSLDDLAKNAGQIDVLVNNCGGPPPGPISAVTDEAWLAQFEMIFLGNCRLARAFLELCSIVVYRRD